MLKLLCINDECKSCQEDTMSLFYITKKVRIVVDEKGEMYKDYMETESNFVLSSITFKCEHCNNDASISF